MASYVIPNLNTLGEVNNINGLAAEAPAVRIAVSQALVDLLAVDQLPCENIGGTITNSLLTEDESVVIGVMRALEKGMLDEKRPIDFQIFGPECPLDGLMDKILDFQSQSPSLPCA